MLLEVMNLIPSVLENVHGQARVKFVLEKNITELYSGVDGFSNFCSSSGQDNRTQVVVLQIPMENTKIGRHVSLLR
jgi:hypothetical protein